MFKIQTMLSGTVHEIAFSIDDRFIDPADYQSSSAC